ncbi:MAG: hypothetical protein F6K39_24110 [Okeania sp. SIO3B3]|nr:hypothetical protein [Okeania sp. SIO3B3]
MVCEYSVGRASALATSLLHDRFYMSKYMNVLMGWANCASATCLSECFTG